MADGDKFLYETSAKVLLASVGDPQDIRYRQRVLADCLAQPEVIRQMYAVAVAALADKRQLWGGYGGSFQNPSSNLSGAVSHLEAFVARLRQLRQIADDHGAKFRSRGYWRCSPPCTATWTTSTSRKSMTTSSGCVSAPEC